MGFGYQPNNPESQPGPQPGPEQNCSSESQMPPQSSDNCACDHQAALISADIDAGQSGVQIDVDVLGVNVADVSLGLGGFDLPVDDILHHC
jgi:hypothetical protein